MSHRFRWLVLLLIPVLGGALFQTAGASDQPRSQIDPLVMSSRKAPVTVMTAGMLLDIARAGSRLVAVGERGHIIFSDDNGTTWQQADVPVSVMLTGVYFPTSQKGWAVGYDGIVLHTTDGGQTWALQISDAQTIDLMLTAYASLLDDAKSRLSAQQSDQQSEADPDLEMRVEDIQFAWEDWKNSKAEGVCPPFMDVWFKNEAEGLILGAFGLLMRTEDGGRTWQPVIESLENFGGYHYYCVIPSNNSLFLAGEVGMLYRSDDEGRSWTRLEGSSEGSYFGIVSRQGGRELIAFGIQGQVARSVDGGNRWEEIAKIGSNLCGATTTASGDAYFIGPNGNIYRMAEHSTELEQLEDKFLDASTLIEVSAGKLIAVGLSGLITIQVQGTGG